VAEVPTEGQREFVAEPEAPGAEQPAAPSGSAAKPAHEERAEYAEPRAQGASGPGMPLGPLVDVPLRITVELGSTRMLVREVLQLSRGSVVPLDRLAGDPAEVFVNGRLIARGEVTAIDDSLAVRIVELVSRSPGEHSG